MCGQDLPGAVPRPALVEEVCQFTALGHDWVMVFAALSGTLNQSPQQRRCRGALQRMVDAIKGGAHETRGFVGDQQRPALSGSGERRDGLDLRLARWFQCPFGGGLSSPCHAGGMPRARVQRISAALLQVALPTGC